MPSTAPGATEESDPQELLAKAFAAGDACALDRALRLGADPDFPGTFYLADALRNGRADLAEALFPLSDTSRQDPYGFTPLLIASASGEPSLIELALRHCDPLAPGRDGATALMLAASTGFPNCAKALLPFCDPDARDARGKTALHLALLFRAEACAVLLIPATDLSIRDNDGLDPEQAARVSMGEAMAGRIAAAALARREAGALQEAASLPAAGKPRNKF